MHLPPVPKPFFSIPHVAVREQTHHNYKVGSKQLAEGTEEQRKDGDGREVKGALMLFPTTTFLLSTVPLRRQGLS